MPLRSLSLAIAAASDLNNRIYVCGGVDEAIVVPSNRRIHGDLTCGWTWNFSIRNPWTSPSDTIPLRTEANATDVVVTGFDIEAADATTPGGSSIGVLATLGQLELARVDVAAGNGADGVAGVSGQAGSQGADGGDGSSGYPGNGGAGGPSAMCLGGGGGGGGGGRG